MAWLTRYLAGKDTTTPAAQTDGAIHSYTVAFGWAGTIFATGALACGVIPRGGEPQPADPTLPRGLRARGAVKEPQPSQANSGGSTDVTNLSIDVLTRPPFLVNQFDPNLIPV